MALEFQGLRSFEPNRCSFEDFLAFGAILKAVVWVRKRTTTQGGWQIGARVQPSKRQPNVAGPFEGYLEIGIVPVIIEAHWTISHLSLSHCIRDRSRVHVVDLMWKNRALQRYKAAGI